MTSRAPLHRWTSRHVRVVALVLGLATLAPSTALGARTASVRIDCPALSRERAAAFDARARAELLVRGEQGLLTLDCSESPSLIWSTDGGTVSQGVRGLSTETMLEDLNRLLDDAALEAPQPTPSEQSEASYVALRTGAETRLWGDRVAPGVRAGFAWHWDALSVVGSGHAATGFVADGGIRVFLLDTRIGAELRLLEPLTLGAGTGVGRPITTFSSAVAPENTGDDVWFGLGWVSASVAIARLSTVQLRLGAELSVQSRSLRVVVDETRRVDFQFQPSVFLEAAFEFR